MKKHLIKFTCALFGALFIAQNSIAADDVTPVVKELQDQWAIIKYQTPKKEREKAFEALANTAHARNQAHPNRAELLVWEAIILSTYAGEKGGLGALGLVKDAKALLETAEKIDASVLNGSVYTSLGSLYYQVPGWPIGFGDDDKAEQYLKKALQISQDDIDANYFYGDYLLQDGQYREAVKVFEKALNAPPRTGRDLADAGRKEEIKAALGKAKSKL